ncbi:MAG: MAPEG family protein [Pseudomonadota bacterium]
MITGLYASILIPLFFVLMARVILYRRRNRIGLGDAGDRSLLKRIRAHSNFIETAPLALILMALIELQDGSRIGLHILGVNLVLGRMLHAYGFSASPPKMMFRTGGIFLTLTMIGACGVWLFVLAIRG